MLIAIRHITRYAYLEAADYSIESLRLTPPSFDGQKVLAWNVEVVGGSKIEVGRDGFGNIAHLATVIGRHDEVVIEAEGEVETTDRNGVVRGLADPVPPRVFLRRTEQTMPDEAVIALAEQAAAAEPSAIGRLHRLSALIDQLMEFEVGVTDAHTSAGEALADRKGVCQDFAHIFIAAARHLGIPARYVTGYLLMNDEGTSQAHHAWAEAFVDDLGWVGFDVANNVCPTERYVRLACGLDARSAAPVRGSRRGGENETLDVHVVVEGGDSQSQTQQQ
jgi:transglutaminase-like putative cysteine protease